MEAPRRAGQPLRIMASSTFRKAATMSRHRLPSWIAVGLLAGACPRTPETNSATSASTAPTAAPAESKTAAYTDQDISDAWIYLLGRLLVLRQQKADLAEGWTWNTLVHRKPGAVDWPNPNLDVA